MALQSLPVWASAAFDNNRKASAVAGNRFFKCVSFGWARSMGKIRVNITPAQLEMHIII
jgi:hypothetical protein